MNLKVFSKSSFFLLTMFLVANVLFGRTFTSVTGEKIEGEVIKNFGDYILFKQAEDHQLFRFKIEILCDKDQAFVKNNFAPVREEVPKLQRPLQERQLLQLALGADTLVEQQLRKYSARPNKTVDDETFLRRAYLKIVGRIPTLVETNAFLLNRNRTAKRRQLVDQLINSEGYASHWFHFWADILRAKDRMQGASGSAGRPYITFIKDFIKSNKPYDQFVRELISSRGPIWEKGNGAVGYYFRDRGMPLDNMANTIRIFLGTSLECAQCHDHPFDRWTQKQFYEMSAFTHGAGDLRRKEGTENLASFNKLVREQEDEDGKLRRSARMIRDILQFGLDSKGEGKIRLPKDYQYDNAKPNQEVQAKTIFGLAVELDENLKEIGSRETYANWLASDANPRFTTVIANRLWKQVMGVGLIEPVDNMMDDTTASNPALMTYLEKLMYALDYDTREFLRVLYNTKIFHRAAPKQQYSLSSEVPYLYPGPILERMSAEQIWDSLLVLTYPNVDNRKVSNEPMEYDQFVRYSNMSGEELLSELLSKVSSGDKKKANNKDAKGKKVAPADNVNCPIKPGRAADPAITAVGNDGKAVAFCCNGCKNRFIDQQATAAKPKGPKKKALGNDMMMGEGVVYVNRNEVRASEVSSPAPIGHLVREFGGSDREQIQNGHKDASVTQILSLLNGYVEKKIIRNKKAVAMKNMEVEETMEKKVNAIFYTILNRKPDAHEQRDAKDAVKRHGDEAYADLLWTLVNSHEFLFVQ